jgi:hypothetical protein
VKPLFARALVLQVVLAAPRELRKADFERGIIARRGVEYLHAGAHDLWSYTITPMTPISTAALC